MKKALIVDDDPSIRLGMRASLEDLGFEVVEARDGADGFEAVLRENPAIVLTDLRMPNLDGCELAEKVSTHDPLLPIIVISGTGNIKDAVEAVRRGAWDYLEKPIINIDELGIIVGHALEKALLLKENLRYREHLEALVDERTLELLEKSEALTLLNATLEERVTEETEKNRQKDILIAEQTRLASMGEVLTNIAHQWRQPLNQIGLFVQSLQGDFDDGALTREKFDTTVDECMGVLRSMSKTIDNFRTLFRPDGPPRSFDLGEVVSKTVTLFHTAYHSKLASTPPIDSPAKQDTECHPKPVCENIKFYSTSSSGYTATTSSGIPIRISGESPDVISGYPNEFSQALLNIIENALNILSEREIVNPEIVITYRASGGHSTVSIADNGGGIDTAIIDKIFDPYFSTKFSSQGVGIGLYMTKMIVERAMDGRLTVHNKSNGAEFIIELPLATVG